MKSALEVLIAGAPERLEIMEARNQQELTEREAELQSKEARVFRQRVHTALSSEVLASLGAVTFGSESGAYAMKFQVKGNAFELRQAIGSVVNLLAGNREIFQFNLSSPEAKDRFLEALGEALASTT